VDRLEGDSRLVSAGGGEGGRYEMIGADGIRRTDRGRRVKRVVYRCGRSIRAVLGRDRSGEIRHVGEMRVRRVRRDGSDPTATFRAIRNTGTPGFAESSTRTWDVVRVDRRWW
jgi:hypothetical protein